MWTRRSKREKKNEKEEKEDQNEEEDKEKDVLYNDSALASKVVKFTRRAGDSGCHRM